MTGTAAARALLATLLMALAGCVVGCDRPGHSRDGGGTDLGATDGDDGGVLVDDSPVSLSVRLVNACATSLDVYVAGASTPILQAVAPGQASGWVATMLGKSRGALAVRPAGAAAAAKPLAVSDALMPAAGDRATVAVRGPSCAILPLVEHFAATPPGSLRVRFVEAAGQRTPQRLYWEAADGSFQQAAAVATFGESGPDGALVPAPPAGRDSVRVRIDTELSDYAGTPGYQLPASLLGDGAHLFLFTRPGLVWLVGPDATLAQIALNPAVVLVQAVSDVCGAGMAHVAFSDGSGQALGSVDVGFAREAPLILPPTTSGHTITVSGAGGCSGVMASTTTGPLAAGMRYVQVVYGSAAGNALHLFTTAAGVPAGVTPPAIAFFNAASGAPPLDLFSQAFGDDGGEATLFNAVGVGALSPWQVAPGAAYTLVLAERPSVTSSFVAGQSALFIAAGDFAAGAPVPLRLLHHSLQ